MGDSQEIKSPGLLTTRGLFDSLKMEVDPRVGPELKHCLFCSSAKRAQELDWLHRAGPLRMLQCPQCKRYYMLEERRQNADRREEARAQRV